MTHHDHKKSSKLGIGVAIGAIAGAAAATYLASKEGKKVRKDLEKRAKEFERYIKKQKLDERVREIYGTVTEEAQKTVEAARDELSSRLVEISKKAKDFDRGQYEKLVEDVVEKVKEGTTTSVEQAKRLSMSLKSYWEALVGEGEEHVVKPAKKTVKKTVKKAAKKVSKTAKK